MELGDYDLPYCQFGQLRQAVYTLVLYLAMLLTAQDAEEIRQLSEKIR